MLRSAEEIIKARYPFYNPDRISQDVELDGEHVTQLINIAREEAIIECSERAVAWCYNEGEDVDYGVDKESILDLIKELK